MSRKVTLEGEQVEVRGRLNVCDREVANVENGSCWSSIITRMSSIYLV